MTPMDPNAQPEPPLATVGAIVLAAGRSSRFEGGHKLLASTSGKPLIRHVLETMVASRAGQIVLVIAPGGEAVANAAGAGRWRTMANPGAEGGLSTSIRAGIAALDSNVNCALIVLADMPGITSDLIDRLIDAGRENAGAIVHPVTADGRQGHPVLWPRDLFPRLLELEGDSGAKRLLKDHAARVVRIPAGNADPVTDIDTRRDWEAFKARGGG